MLVCNICLLQGYTNAYYQISPAKAYPRTFSGLNRHIFCIPSPHSQFVGMGSTICKLGYQHSISRDRFTGHCMSVSSPSLFGSRVFHACSHKHAYPGRFRIYAALDVATAVQVINDLGFDTLTFLAVIVMVVPAFKFIRASPVSLLFFFSICSWIALLSYLLHLAWVWKLLVAVMIFLISFVWFLYQSFLLLFVSIQKIVDFVCLLFSCHNVFWSYTVNML